ncbi:MAG: alkylphosphonate utilization protein [Tissierellia bacterium]|nr:alkylphosphonate utilization protein [Tissierellia bacterium]
MSYPPCPKCNSKYTYEDMWNYVCPECGNEWAQEGKQEEEKANTIKDAHGQELLAGDKVSVIRDLKMGKDVIKQGTIVRNIRILDEPVNGHDIEAKVDGVGSVYLKGEVVKKLV